MTSSAAIGLRTSIADSLASSSFSHLELVRSQLPRSSFVAAGCCLRLGEAMGAPSAAVHAVAEAIALLETMSLIVHDIGNASPPADSLIHDWDMPRTLNAADACYALAQQRMLELQDDKSLDVDRVFNVLERFDQLCYDLSDVLALVTTDTGPGWRQPVDAVLLSGGVGLAALLAGRNAETASSLSRALDNAIATFEAFRNQAGLAKMDASGLLAELVSNTAEGDH